MSDAYKSACKAVDHPVILLKAMPRLEGSLVRVFCDRRWGTDHRASRALAKTLLRFSTSTPAFHDRSFSSMRFLLGEREEDEASHAHMTRLDCALMSFHALSPADLEREGLVCDADPCRTRTIRPVPVSHAVPPERIKEPYLSFRSEPAAVQYEAHRRLFESFAEIESTVGFDAVSAAVVASIPGLEEAASDGACPIRAACPVFRELLNEVTDALVGRIRYDLETDYGSGGLPDARIAFEAMGELMGIVFSRGGLPLKDRGLALTRLSVRIEGKSPDLLGTMVLALKSRSSFCHEMRWLTDALIE